MITLIGATGFTGTLIAQELKRIGASARLAGRDQAKLQELAGMLGGRPDLLQIDVNDTARLSRVFDGATVVINCAGPFSGLSEPVVREAARRGVHYLDTTGEQAFIRYVFDELDDEAKRSGVALVPSCAFEYAIGDIAAELSADGLEPCDEVEIAYVVKGFGTSRGTRKSILTALATQGFEYRNRALVPAPTQRITKQVNFPKFGPHIAASVPFGESILVPCHVATQNVTTLMVLPLPPAILSPALALAAYALKSPLAAPLLNGAGRGSFGPSAEERQRSEFEILSTARRGAQYRKVAVAGRDPYGLTAVIAAFVASLLDRGKTENVGAIAPSMVAGTKAIIDATAAAGVFWSGGEISTQD